MTDITTDGMHNEISVPLCVDLDGTLIAGDMLKISFSALAATRPWALGFAPCWLAQGKASLKGEIARRVSIDPAGLPYHLPFLDWLRDQRQFGRKIWLCTGTHERLAKPIAEYLNLFEGVLATSGAMNLTGETKANVLKERFGEAGFDYCGNDLIDLSVWAACRRAVVVNATPEVVVQASARGNVVLTF